MRGKRPCCSQGDVARNRCAEIVDRAVQPPAYELVALAAGRAFERRRGSAVQDIAGLIGKNLFAIHTVCVGDGPQGAVQLDQIQVQLRIRTGFTAEGHFAVVHSKALRSGLLGVLLCQGHAVVQGVLGERHTGDRPGDGVGAWIVGRLASARADLQTTHIRKVCTHGDGHGVGGVCGGKCLVHGLAEALGVGGLINGVLAADRLHSGQGLITLCSRGRMQHAVDGDAGGLDLSGGLRSIHVARTARIRSAIGQEDYHHIAARVARYQLRCLLQTQTVVGVFVERLQRQDVFFCCTGITCEVHGLYRLAAIEQSAKGDDGYPAVVARRTQQLTGHVQQFGLHVVEPGVAVSRVAQLGHGSGQIGHKDVVHLLLGGVVGIHLDLRLNGIGGIAPTDLLYKLSTIVVLIPVFALANTAAVPAGGIGRQLHDLLCAVQREGACQNGLHTLHHLNAAVVAHLGQGCGGQAGEALAAVECEAADAVLYIFQTVDSFQALTAPEGVLIDGADTAHSNALQASAVVEGVLTDGIGRANFNGFQALAAGESILANGADVVHGGSLQVTAAEERLLTNSIGHANFNSFQALATGESILANGADVVHGDGL